MPIVWCMNHKNLLTKLLDKVIFWSFAATVASSTVQHKLIRTMQSRMIKKFNGGMHNKNTAEQAGFVILTGTMQYRWKTENHTLWTLCRELQLKLDQDQHSKWGGMFTLNQILWWDVRLKKCCYTLLFSDFKTVKTMCILRCYLRPKDLYSVKMLLMSSNSHLVCTHQSCFQVYNEHLQLYTKASFLSHSIKIASCW